MPRAAAKRSEIVLSGAIAALGIFVLLVSATLPGSRSYSAIGANFMPFVVGAGLLLVGLALLAETFTGGWRNAAEDDPAARGEHPLHWPAFAWITAGLFAQMALIGSAGFVIAAGVVFTCVARGFGSARPLRDALIGLGLGLGVFLFFVRFLNVNLPAGWLQPLLGGAGI